MLLGEAPGLPSWGSKLCLTYRKVLLLGVLPRVAV